jgi:spore germination protein
MSLGYVRNIAGLKWHIMPKLNVEAAVVMKYVSANLKENIDYISKCFERCADVVQKQIFINQGQYPIYVVYMDSMIDSDLVENNILKTLVFYFEKNQVCPKVNTKGGTEKEIEAEKQENLLSYIEQHAMLTANVSMVSGFDSIITDIMAGKTAIFGAACDKALMIDGKGYPKRGVDEAQSEVSVRGAKDSFNESLRTNTILIRRRIRDTKLKTEQIKIGRRTQTDIAIMYMDDLVRPEILDEILKELKSFEVDGMFDSGSLEQYMGRRWYSPFPVFQATQRPDKASSALLEGRVVLVVDNSPTVIMAPATLNCFFQASDDYYYRWGIASFTRCLRYVAALIAMGFPGFYVAVATFHPEIFPTSLLLTVAASRRGVPFPLVVEIILMELAFELLREAGIRLPGPMGSALSIVGGLIVGQAAVDANIVSPVVVIVVALTALASFAVPNDNFASAFRLLKFGLIVVGAVAGLPGFVLGLLVILTHLASLESYGIPYLSPYALSSVEPAEEFKDSILRLPLFMMRRRPVFTRAGARVRYKERSEKK